MAEFLEHKPTPDTKVEKDGFANLGKTVPSYRREEAYRTCREDFGLDAASATRVVGGMADAIERDRPYDAIQAGMHFVDLTGTYRLMAVLLVSPKPVVRIKAATEVVA